MIRRYLILLTISSLFFACYTDDVSGPEGDGPLITLSTDQIIIAENSGVALITATLATTSEKDVTIKLAFSGSAEKDGTDYSLDAEEIVVPSRALSSFVKVTAVQDEIEEGNEDIIIRIESAEGGIQDGEQELVINIEDDDVPIQVNLILNEILYDPSNTGLDGDANGDGQYVHAQDEFLEFVNLSSVELDLSSFTIFDDENLALNLPNHVFPEGTIVPSGKCIVVFGGGVSNGSFGGALVQSSTSGDLNMNNSGDKIYLFDPSGTEILSFDITPLSNNPNESYSRNPDLTGEFEQHHIIVEGVLFSPGTKTDGSSF